MEKILKYSVFRYSPSTVAGEKINLGIMFCDESEKYCEFKYSKKFSRLSSFDDEINIDLVKKLLQGIRDDVKNQAMLQKSFDMDGYIKYYINDFSFDKPKMIKYDNLDEMIERLNKTYFRFDYDKKSRPTKEDDKKLIEQLIVTKGKTIKKNQPVYGKCDEKISFDVVTEDYNIKLFDFDGKNLNKLINSAKTWAWNCVYGDGKESIIIYRYNEADLKYHNEFKIIMKIFEQVKVKAYDIEESMQILQGIV